MTGLDPAAIRLLTGAALPDATGARSAEPSWQVVRSTRYRRTGDGKRHRTYLLLRSGGAARWLLPCDDPGLLRDAFASYTPSTRRGRWAWRALDTLAGLRLMPLAGGDLLVADGDGNARWTTFVRDHMPSLQPEGDLHLALHLGAPRRKCPLFTGILIEEGKGPRAALKAAGSRAGNDSIRKEARMLDRLAALDLRSGRVPISLFSGTSGDGLQLLVTDVGPVRWSRADFRFSDSHTRFLVELAEKTACPQPWRDCAARRRMRDDVAIVRDRLGGREARTLTALADAIDRTWTETAVPLSLAHGDFVPWNCRVTDGGLYVFDWEYAVEGAAPLRDAFDFLIQTGTTSAPAVVDRLLGDEHISAFLRAKFHGPAERTIWPSLGTYLIDYIRQFCDEFAVDTQHLAPWFGLMPAVLGRLSPAPSAPAGAHC